MPAEITSSSAICWLVRPSRHQPQDLDLAPGQHGHHPDGIVLLASQQVPGDQEGRVRTAVKLCPSGALRLTPA
ncbi:hypothetical protein A5635_22820 [Mycobacterium asiaticum]|uniref:Divergent 4Fe-4S mono-cluster domain-containing protein n=1 Tax=Mycobacterium asiaticum TaxID=1790 RepID=A0A1A3NJ56_MYCAS|nr:hypothetical protein A5635_22820 [Mycobacterium asiaticum]OBK97675.1 hypothetical protein A5645_00125 [Mycobacterium asiaticum]